MRNIFRLAQITSEALSYSTATADEETDSVEVVWIKAGNSSSLNTTRALMSAWAGGRLEGIFGSFTRCATPLELAAAWNIPAFTTVGVSFKAEGLPIADTQCPQISTSAICCYFLFLYKHVSLQRKVKRTLLLSVRAHNPNLD